MTDATSAAVPRARPPFDLGPMPAGRRMYTLDERLVCAPVGRIFELARAVDE